MDEEIVRRMAALESRCSSSSGGISSDMRVIEMQLARAEEKILRLGRGASWTLPAMSLLMTEEL